MSMNLSSFKKLTIGGIELKQLFIGGVQAWKSGYKNWVPFSTTEDGKTIYNGTGYKEGVRIRSGGGEAEANTQVCTGFIPFKKGDIMRIYPAFSGQNTSNTLNFYDSSYTNLGQYNDNGGMYGICTEYAAWKEIGTEVGTITVIDISAVSNGSNIAFVRLTHMMQKDGATRPHVKSGKELIVTVNEEIT